MYLLELRTDPERFRPSLKRGTRVTKPPTYLFVVLYDTQYGEIPGTRRRQDVALSEAEPLEDLSAFELGVAPQLLVGYVISDCVAISKVFAVVCLESWHLKFIT